MTPVVSLDQLRGVCRFTHTDLLLQALPHLNASFDKAQCVTPIRAAYFLGQMAEETYGFSRYEEDLHYSSALRISLIFRSHFKSEVDAEPFVGQPEKLANRVYADRMGNGDEQSGEGWKYRGRGGCDLTGFDNYRACEASTGLPLVAHPELAAQVENAFAVAAWFWMTKHCNEPADRGDIRGVSSKFNPALAGLSDRQLYTDKFCEQLGVILAA